MYGWALQWALQPEQKAIRVHLCSFVVLFLPKKEQAGCIRPARHRLFHITLRARGSGTTNEHK
jgi:hypothetical protein